LLKKSSQILSETDEFPTHNAETPSASIEKPQDIQVDQEDILRDEDYVEQISTEFERISTRQKHLAEMIKPADNKNESLPEQSAENRARHRIVKKPRRESLKKRQSIQPEQLTTPITIIPNEVEQKDDQYEESIEKAIHMERRYDVSSAGKMFRLEKLIVHFKMHTLPSVCVSHLYLLPQFV